MGVLVELGLGLIVGIGAVSELVLECGELCLDDLRDTREGVAARVFRVIPIEAIEKLGDGDVFVTSFDVPVVSLGLLQIQILPVDFL